MDLFDNYNGHILNLLLECKLLYIDEHWNKLNENNKENYTIGKESLLNVLKEFESNKSLIKEEYKRQKFAHMYV
jgi:hypothetical protein